MNAVTTSPATITVSQSNSSLSSALSTFVSAYNAAFAAVGQQRGQSGGALTGDSLIFGLGSMLGNMVDYNTQDGSGVSSLADLGITIGSDGTLSFNSATFASASSSAIQNFLGGTTSGGWLQGNYNALDTFANTVTGQIGGEFNTIGTQITSDQAKITEDQATIATLTANLQKQLSAADAAIASLQSQNSYLEQLFTATYGSSSTSAANGG
jgi:flagellar hook-associated protein 2